VGETNRFFRRPQLTLEFNIGTNSDSVTTGLTVKNAPKHSPLFDVSGTIAVIFPRVVKEGVSDRMSPSSHTDMLVFACEWAEATPTPPLKTVKEATLYPFPEGILASLAVVVYRLPSGWGVALGNSLQASYHAESDLQFQYLKNGKWSVESPDLRLFMVAKARGRTHDGGYVNEDTVSVLDIPNLGKVKEFDLTKASFKPASRREVVLIQAQLLKDHMEATHVAPPPTRD
jgi:hypothetical protein